jgi:hypothetical protein
MEEKADLLRALPRDGLAVLNADDPRFDALRERTQARVIPFALQRRRALSRDLGALGREPARVPAQRQGSRVRSSRRLPQRGQHARRARRVALELGVPLAHRGARAAFVLGSAHASVAGPRRPGPGDRRRLQRQPRLHERGDQDLLADPLPGRRVLVLGDMRELGDEAEALHRAVGAQLSIGGFDLVIGVGPLTRHLLDEAPERGFDEPAAASLRHHRGRGARRHRAAARRRRRPREGLGARSVSSAWSPRSRVGGSRNHRGPRSGDAHLLILHFLRPYASEWWVANLFHYISVRSAAAGPVGLSAGDLRRSVDHPLLGKWHVREAVEKTDSEKLRELHGKKKNTPTMGGFIMLAAILSAVFLFGNFGNSYVWLAFCAVAGFGLIGFVDDYIKLHYRDRKGLQAASKMVLQGGVALALGFALLRIVLEQGGDQANDLLTLRPPFLKNWALPLSGLGYMLMAAFIVVGTSNGVNLADGLDGLATGCVILAAAAFAVIVYLVGRVDAASYLQVLHVKACGELAVVASLAGRRLPGLPVVQRASGAGVHGRHGLPAARRAARLSRGRGEARAGAADHRRRVPGRVALL